MEEKIKIMQAQRDIVQGYYIRIGMNPDTTTEEIMQWLEDDLQTLKMDDVLIQAETIIKNGNTDNPNQ